MTAQLDIISAFAKARVAVLGDVMLDRFVQGEVSRISPEAPIPVLHVARESVMLGGAGNVASNLVRLGGGATLIAAVGQDAAAQSVLDAAAREKGLTAQLTRDAGVTTIIKTRFVAQGQQLLRVDEEKPGPLPASAADHLLAALDKVLGDAKILILSDYGKGVLCERVLARAIAAAKAAKIAVIVDPKGRDFRRYAGADLITPNAHEAAAATGLSCDSDADVAAAARAIAAMTGGDVLITRGAKGMSLLARGAADVLHIPTVAHEVADVSGAGDTVIATLALALATGAPLADAARLANLAAGVAVGKSGTAPVEAAELIRAVQMSQFLTGSAKVVPLAEAAEVAQGWKAQGRKVVFTNGCFDLLHPGHVRLLQKARAEGDKLIVALNSDASVKRLKGPTRPIQDEEARAAVMASIGVVDLVTIFTEDTPLEAIAAIRPDVLVKGADYTEDQVVGGDVVKAHGGRVVLVQLEAGHSTTGAIARANKPG